MEYEGFQTSHGNLDNVINTEEIAILGWTFLLLAQKKLPHDQIGTEIRFFNHNVGLTVKRPELGQVLLRHLPPSPLNTIAAKQTMSPMMIQLWSKTKLRVLVHDERAWPALVKAIHGALS